MKTIYIFTKNGCSHCKELKKKLTNESISFYDVEITKNNEIWENVVSQTGFDILPTVFIVNDNDNIGTAYTPGVDFKDVNEIVEIIKNIIQKKGD
jgi:glutaredoxin